MARPKKFRKVCTEPKVKTFVPKIVSNNESEDFVELEAQETDEDEEEVETSEADEIGEVTLDVEEFEVIRLIDYRDLDQIETAEKMEIARSTVQRIYKEARAKIADALVNGKKLHIEGGQYRLCEDFFIVEVCPDCPSKIKNKHKCR